MNQISVPKLMRAVEIKRKKDAKTWLEVTNELGFLSTATIFTLRKAKWATFNAERLVAILQWLGTTDFSPYLVERYQPGVTDEPIKREVTEWMVWWGSDRQTAEVYMMFDNLDLAEKAMRSMPGGRISYQKTITYGWVDVPSTS